jgi:predicted MFS family arabinose efflux permease
MLVSLPLLLCIVLVWWLLPARPANAGIHPGSDHGAAGWAQLLRNRNMILASLIAICFISRIFIVSSFGALYLTGVHHIPLGTVGAMLGISLAGDVLGTLTFGWLADRTGHRKWLVVTLSVLAAGSGAAFALLPAGSPPATLVGCLFLFTLFSGGVIPLMLVIIPTEAVGPAQTASAIGLANFAGEFFGGGLFPILGGVLGDLLGLRWTLLLGAVLAGVAALLGLALLDRRGPHALRTRTPAVALSGR